MNKEIKNISKYFDRIVFNSNHHAPGIGNTIRFLGFETIRLGGKIERYLKNKEANCVWITISGKRLFFTYNHESGKIEIKTSSHKGEILASLDDKNSNSLSIKELFDSF